MSPKAQRSCYRTLCRCLVAVLLLASCTNIARDDLASERYDAFSQEIVYLADGDSVELQSKVPAVIPGEPDGLMVVFHPFHPFDDENRLRELSVALFRTMKTELSDGEYPFVVFRAVDRSAAERSGLHRVRYFGTVIERREDTQWYLLGGAVPIVNE
jgi:hypothetical protein